MSIAEIIAYALKIAGVLFLLIAAVGVLRLPDAFTRMHAATKAGTLGAGLVVIGSALSVSGAEAVGLAIITAIVLLATVPLASHLLARAAYTSGAPFWAGTARDALKGKLARGAEPGEDDTIAAPEPPTARTISRIVVAPTYGAHRRAATAGHKLANALSAPLVFIGLIDERPLNAGGLGEARERLETALDRGRSAGDAEVTSVLVREGAPQDVLLETHNADDLIVLPPVGWFDHDVAGPEAWAEAFGVGRGESLLPVAQGLPRPVLLAGDIGPIERVVILDDGTRALEAAIAMLAAGPLFPGAALRVTWEAGEPLTPERRAALSAAAGSADLGFQAPTGAAGTVRDPGDVFVCRRIPGAARGEWYGTDWRDRIAPDWRGGLLLV
ncbi:MAG: monovalent cation/H(+) antiporter subunit G [Pseudomonadota bacterium]